MLGSYVCDPHRSATTNTHTESISLEERVDSYPEEEERWFKLYFLTVNIPSIIATAIQIQT